MKVGAFSIYDEKACAYAAPFFLPHKGMALRAFGDLVEDKNSKVNKHPNDYSLYKLGDFDDESGQVKGHVPEFLAKATEFINGGIPVDVA